MLLRLRAGHLLVKVLGDGVQEVHCVKIHAILDIRQSVNASGQILRHLARVDRVDTGLFQQLGKASQFGVAVQFSTVLQSPGPGEDRRDWVGRSRAAFLVLPETTQFAPRKPVY